MVKVVCPVLLSVLAGLAIGCGHEDAGPPRILSVTVTPDEVAAGATVEMTVETENFELIVEGEHEHLGPDEPVPYHGGGEASGHFHIYFDNLLDNPLVMATTSTFDVDIPDDATAGTHQLLVRLHSASHEIIEPQVISAAAIVVE